MEPYSIELDFIKYLRDAQSLKPLISYRSFLVICSDPPTEKRND
jgi:hypothetical protein